MKPQLTRLAIIFAIVIAALVAARIRLVPETFGDLGHYRAAAVDVEAGRSIKYAGLSSCGDCHPDEKSTHAAGNHHGVGCEICHGPAAAHVEDPLENVPSKPQGRHLCELCHSYDPARPTGFAQIEPVRHHPLQSCTTCHEAHAPVPPVTPEGCAGCHGQIARTKAVSHHAPLSCTVCHEADEQHKSDPVASRPSKPSSRSFCGQCHSPDAGQPAGIVQEIRRVDMESHGGRYVCWQCHYPHFPELK